MPACGVVAGMLARCDQGGVWNRMPPDDTTLKGGLAPLPIGRTCAQTTMHARRNARTRVTTAIMSRMSPCRAVDQRRPQNQNEIL